jgi:hypothetical protein
VGAVVKVINLRQAREEEAEIYDAEQVSGKPVTITTEFGEAVVAPGDYVLTSEKTGKKHGVFKHELEDPEYWETQ